MPRIDRKICSKHGIYTGKTCPQCKTERNKIYDDTARSKESAKVYQSSKWKKLREKVLIRDGFQCVKCGKVVGIKPKDHAVDHVVELKDGGAAFDINNLELLCQSCHSTKTAEEKRKRNEK